MPVPAFTAGEILTAANMNQVGSWLVKTQTIGTTVSSVTVNDAFSSTYDNYLITVSGGSASANVPMYLQMGGVTTGYYTSFILTSWNNTVAGDSSTNAASWIYSGSCGIDGNHLYCVVSSPNLAKTTRVSALGGGLLTTYVGSLNGLLNNTSQYTSFVIGPQSGTMTGGTICVYGYRN
jgi:hypothetical protein